METIKKDSLKLTESWNSLIKSYAEKSVVTYSEAIRADSKPLAALRIEYGSDVVISGLIRIIGENIRFFALGKAMNDLQVVETAKLIAGEYY
mgnify:FL=1